MLVVLTHVKMAVLLDIKAGGLKAGGLKARGIKAIVFDKDGTLFDFNAVWSVWCDRVVNELSAGDNQLSDRLATSIGYNRKDRTFVTGSLIVSASAEDSVEAMTALLDEHSFSSVNEVCKRLSIGLPLAPVNGLEDTLSQLKNSGLKLGVATNDSEASAHEQLADGNIADYFDFVCGYDSGFGSKPAPGMLLAFSQATALPVSEIAMVGDSLHDIDAGIAAGFGLTVGVLTGPASKSDLTGHADVVMEDIRGLVAPDW